jgi:alkanesulfonate monooxygenase SsuD/methylene tetrahydromethanopterin reductase-like flavin-dependent oxidoreductase (luciferase family)
MPFHHPNRDYGQILEEDQEAIVLADRLGFTEAFVGEHFSQDYLADPDNGLSFYYTFFHFSFSRGRKALFMLKPDLELPDEDVTMDMIKRTLIIAGTPARVLDQLVALREETGHFGTLLMGGHDWDQPALWRRSMELLATEVMPKFSRHASSTRA